MNATKIAALHRALADAFEEGGATVLQAPTGLGTAALPPPTHPAPPAATAVPRGRGRPPKAEVTPPVAPEPVHVAPVAVEVDPFASAAPPAAPVTLDTVRKVLTDLRAASSQGLALHVLKDAGVADNFRDLKPDKYGAVVSLALAQFGTIAPKAEVDPFEVAAGPALAAAMAEPVVEAVPSFDDLSAAIIDAQKRTNADVAQKVVMAHGGVGTNAATGVKGASLKALPLSEYAKVIAALKALPSTK